MTDKIKENLLGDLYNFLKNHKVLFVLACGLFILRELKNNYNDVYAVVVETSKATIELLLANMATVAFLVIVYAIIQILLIKSDKEFQKECEDHFPDVEVYDSHCKNPVEIKVIEKRDYTKGERKIKREISVYNRMDETIDSIKGRIDFLYFKKRIMPIEFCFEDLEPNIGHRIFNAAVGEDEIYWDEFQAKIHHLKTKNREKSNVDIYGAFILRSHFLVLNRFQYFRIWKFRLPYEISWLKELWKYKIRPFVEWSLRVRTKYGNITFMDVVFDVLKSAPRIIALLLLMGLVIYGVLYQIYKALLIAVHITNIWWDCIAFAFERMF